MDVMLVQEAYHTLSSPTSREKHDAQLSRKGSNHCSRPAAILSLDEFLEEEDDNDQIVFTHPCRCGALYKITEREMDEGKHLVGCSGCSEAVWVGYELVEVQEGAAVQT